MTCNIDPTHYPSLPPAHTPWGASQNANQLGPGIWLVSTASHGGVWLSPNRLAELPADMQATRYSRGGWFEEDCDSLIPIVAFYFDICAFHDEHPGEDILVGHKPIEEWISYLRAVARVGKTDQYWSAAQVASLITLANARHRALDPHCTCNDCIAFSAGEDRAEAAL